MRDRSYLEEREYSTASDIIHQPTRTSKLVAISKEMTVEEAILILNKEGISQIPICDGDQIVGSITDSKLLKKLIENPDIKKQKVEEFMGDPLPFVAPDSTIDVISSLLDKEISAVLVRDEKNETNIITQHDILMAMTS